MRDHNETYEAPEHNEHPNEGTDVSFSPWGGDNLENPEEHPNEAPPEPHPEPPFVAPELLLMGDAFWGWSRLWSRP